MGAARELRIGTWNCFGMGQGLDAVLHRRAPHGRRFSDADVKRGCCSFDVLCVQEILSRQAQRFFDELDPAHYVARVRDDNRPKLDGSMRGSGLGLGVSARVAMRGARLRSFAGARVGWDRLARKGTIYAALDLGDGLVVDLVNVHLQAGYDDAAREVRLAQLAHVRALVDEAGAADRPFVVCGDLNICGLAASRSREGAEYRALSDALEGFVDLGAVEDLPTFHPHPDGNALAYAFEPSAPAQRLDYVLLRSAGRATCTSVSRFFDQPTSSGWPSDHYGFAATLRFAP